MEYLSEEDIRAMVREFLASSNISEYDALVQKEKDWKEESRELRALMVDLLKHIENDDYQEGLDKIDKAIFKLKSWKHKIEKFLD